MSNWRREGQKVCVAVHCPRSLTSLIGVTQARCDTSKTWPERVCPLADKWTAERARAQEAGVSAHSVSRVKVGASRVPKWALSRRALTTRRRITCSQYRCRQRQVCHLREKRVLLVARVFRLLRRSVAPTPSQCHCATLSQSPFCSIPHLVHGGLS